MTPPPVRSTISGTDITNWTEKVWSEFAETSSAWSSTLCPFPHRTVAGNVEYGLEIRESALRSASARVREVLKLVGLQDGRPAPRRVERRHATACRIARALAVDPDILLMDEAFSALDPLIKREMQDELLALQARLQKTIVSSPTIFDEALKLGDRIAIMKDGRIEQIGTPEEIVSGPASEYVAAFTAGVDRSKILTASSVMKPPDPVIRPKDGPHTALQHMRRHGISSIFMVDTEGKLLGLVLAADARASSRSRGDVPDGLNETRRGRRPRRRCA